MDRAEVRAVLSTYRAGEPLINEARFQEAVAQAEADPELGEWWAEQQKVEQFFTSKLQNATVPADLKTRVAAWEERASRRTSLNRITMLAAASIVALATLFGSWRGPFQPAVSLADYRDEMVSFIKLDPFLEMETPQLSSIAAYLRNAGAPSQLDLPQKLEQTQHPLGCRIFRFRGQEVALICFGREQGDLVHLFVVNRAALSHLSGSDQALRYQAVGEWMTATWIQGDQAYLITVQGDRAKLEKYLTSS